MTKLGGVASTSGLDLLFVRQAVRRIEDSEAADYREIAAWAIEDYLAEEKHKEKWLAAVREWLDEVDVRKISHPARYRGDFEQRSDPEGYDLPAIEMPEPVVRKLIEGKDENLYVNLPKLKTHSMAGVSLGIKPRDYEPGPGRGDRAVPGAQG